MQKATEDAQLGFGGPIGVIRLSPEQREQLLDADKLDVRHTTRLKAIIEQHGWPTYRMVGRQAVDAALMIVRRTQNDLDFQARALDLVVKSGEGDKAAIARLVDDVAVTRGEPQIYGTQYTCRNGSLVLATPIKDTGDGLTITERRAAMGLPPNEIDDGQGGFKRGILCDPAFGDDSSAEQRHDHDAAVVVTIPAEEP